MKIKQRRLLIWLISVSGAVALYAVLGFFLVPVIARKQIEEKGSAQLAREVSLQRVRFNPFTFAGSLEKLRVAGQKDGDLGGWDILRFNFDPWESLVRREWRFGQLSLVAPAFNMVIDQNGRLNVADIAAGNISNARNESSTPPKIGIDRLEVKNGSFHFTDRSRESPFSSTVHPIDFVLENFSTAKEAGGAYRLSGKTTSDESFTWKGNISVAPVSSRGELAFENIRLPEYMPFVQPFIRGEISDGQLNVSAKYDVAAGKETKAMITDLALRLTQLKFKLPEGKQAAALASLEVDAPELNPIARTAHLARVAVDGVTIEAVRGPDGQIDLASLIPPAKSEPKTTEAKVTESKPFALTVDTVSLVNGAVSFTDQALEEPARIQADQIHLTATGFGPALDKAVALDAGLRLENGPGQVTVKGNVHPQPLLAEVEVAGSELPVGVVAAYLKPFAAVQIASGTAEFNGQLRVAQQESVPMGLTWSGSAAVRNLGVTGSEGGEPLLSWNRVGLTGVNLDLPARQLQIQEVQINQPSVLAVMKEDGSLNLTTVLKKAGPAKEDAGVAAATPPPDGAQPPFAIKVAAVAVTDGSATFRDQSTQPVPEAKMGAITGTLTNLSTQADTASQVDLSATVLQSPPASIKGRINLLGKDVFAGSDLTLDLKGVRLEALEPYAMKYLGYKIQKGRMEGDFEYELSGETLQGQNHVVLDNFYLGEPVQSPQAMSLPIKLALAVLRNREGKVILNVPVSGSVTSPQFSFGEAIRQALQNSFGKIVSAPFALLGSLFGAPDADLSQINFSGGAAELSDEARRNLDTLARALQERPDLQLTLRWVAAPEQDRSALAAQRLQPLIEEKKQKLAVAEPGVSDAQALLALYQERVPPKPTNAGQGPEQALAAPTEPERRPPWYVRLYRFVFQHNALASRTTPAASGREATLAAPNAADLDRVRQELAATIQVEPQAFVALARARAEAAQQYLAKAGVEPTRLQLAPEPGAPEGKPAEGPRVYFTLDEKPPAS